jgi:hypothetical protein
MLQTKIVEKIKIHILCSIAPPPKKKNAIYEIMSKNIVELDRPQMAIWHMCIS